MISRLSHELATILLVDDEPLVRRLVAELLAQEGYEVLAAQSGAEALRLAERHQGPIHLLLTDVMMPDMKGPELADRMAAARPGVRILYMSGYTGKEICSHNLTAQRAGYLQKPFRPDVLAAKVREMLEAPVSRMVAQAAVIVETAP